jgi:phosphatidylserine/phosphatidylglycerophosphate/cardiolipin synthase-like enzyme
VYDALVDAMDAGVKVRLVVDSVENAAKTSYANLLKAKGADIKFWTKAKLHAKLAIYDGTYPQFLCSTRPLILISSRTQGELAVSGSFNWSDNGVTKGNTELVISLHQKSQIHETQLAFDALHSESE